MRPNPWPIPEAYHEEVMNLRLFAMKRLSWLNGYMPQHCAHESVREQQEVIMAIYPNPARDWVNISLLKPIKGPVTLELFNSTGQLIKSVNLRQENNAPFIYDCSGHIPGLYFIRITGEENSYSENF